MTVRQLERLIRNSIRNENTGCLEWRRYCLPNGYGRIRVGSRSILAHRLSYELNIGEIPIGMWVCHRCDNRRCIEPNHLFLGASADNSADMVAKNRQARGDKVAHRGEVNGRAKLTNTDILAIRSDDRLQRKIASEYGIARSLVSRIKSRKLWDHIR